jgi:single-strand DNA-binding protein
MNSLNKVQIIGNLTANPDVKETPNGQKVCTIGIATSRQWKDQSGAKQEVTEFHNVVLWRGLAEVAEKYVTKGQKVYIEGYLQTRTWEDQTGAKRYRTEIVGEELIMLSSKSKGSEDDSPFGEEEPKKESVRDKVKKRDDEIHIEDIPF